MNVLTGGVAVYYSPQCLNAAVDFIGFKMSVADKQHAAMGALLSAMGLYWRNIYTVFQAAFLKCPIEIKLGKIHGDMQSGRVAVCVPYISFSHL